MPYRSFLSLSLTVMLTVYAVSLPAEAAPPNILYIMIDDLGWMDLHCQGGKDYRTPNIDRLAAQGMRFTDAYAAAPVCSPTRAAAMTGLAPARLRITNHIPDSWNFYNGKKTGPGKSVNQLDPKYVTIAERLKEQGYGTAFFGKWHLSGADWGAMEKPFLPESQGFDINIGGCARGGPGGDGSFFDPYPIPNIPARKKGQYLPDRLADEAIEYMRSQKEKKQSFFICLWNYTVHWPVEAPESLYRNYAEDKPTWHQKYQAMVEGMDLAVGKVLKSLDDLGLGEDTLVVFTSDNGPFTNDGLKLTTTAPLKGKKGYLSDGGIRVPLIVRWRGKIKAGTICREPVITMDLVPTFLESAGISYKAATFDGESMMPLLTQSGALKRDAIHFHYPHYAFHRANRMGAVIRSGDYKMIKYYEDQTVVLYDMRKDIGETRDLSEEMPEKTAELRKRLEVWLKETNAAMPRDIAAIPASDLHGRRADK
ncbi:MAG: sulfatase [Kiritimatiellia bacterium]|jgi:arylsulfatase A-like enzyme|nr:sulfatase [Kiritimatiellia bacterium]